MEYEEIQKTIQQWTSNIPLIILGSGASIPCGLPSMWTLGEHLKSAIKLIDTKEIEEFEKFKIKLDSVKDLEVALTEVQLSDNVVEKIIDSTWELISNSDLNFFDGLISGSLQFPLIDLVRYLITTADRKVSIITTNYDRLAEYAGSIVGAFIYTGYANNYIGDFAPKIHQNNLSNLKGYSGLVNVLKVHGSLDWFANDNKEMYIPLRQNIPTGYRPLIVTPGISKYSTTHGEPYRTVFSQSDTEIENAKGFLCVGYGFNDKHVHPKLITQIKLNKPIIVITRDLTPNTKKAIIDNNCKNYILIESDGKSGSRIYSSMFSGDLIIDNINIWQLAEYNKLLT